MEATFRYILKQFLDPYITGLDGRIDYSVSTVKILDLKLRDELLDQLREAIDGPVELQEARIGIITLQAVDFGKVQVVASEVVFDLNLVPVKALRNSWDAGRQAREREAPGFAHLLREASAADGYWSALVGSAGPPPDGIRANYCLKHLSDKKRRRAGVRVVDCRICGEKVRTNFTCLAICVRCSLRAGRCLHCGSAEVPVKIPFKDEWEENEEAMEELATEGPTVLPLGKATLLDGGAAGGASSRTQEIYVGKMITVIKPFDSDSQISVPLCIGLKGKVMTIDEDGDAEINFDGIDLTQWVVKDNFPKIGMLQASAPGGDEGPLCAPPPSSHAQDRPAMPPQSRKGPLLGAGHVPSPMPPSPPPASPRPPPLAEDGPAAGPSGNAGPTGQPVTPTRLAPPRWEVFSFELPPPPKPPAAADASSDSDDSATFSAAHREILRARKRQEDIQKMKVPDTEDPCRPSPRLSVNPETFHALEAPAPVRRRVRRAPRSGSGEEKAPARSAERPPPEPPPRAEPVRHALGEPPEAPCRLRPDKRAGQRSASP